MVFEKNKIERSQKILKSAQKVDGIMWAWVSFALWCVVCVSPIAAVHSILDYGAIPNDPSYSTSLTNAQVIFYFLFFCYFFFPLSLFIFICATAMLASDGAWTAPWLFGMARLEEQDSSFSILLNHTHFHVQSDFNLSSTLSHLLFCGHSNATPRAVHTLSSLPLMID